MLTKIGLENFKSWQHLDIDLAPITILFGTNSSGKTSILQALLLLKQTVDNFDQKQHINFGGGKRDYVDFGSYQDLVYGHDEKQSIGINVGWNQHVPKSNYNEEYNGVFTDWKTGQIDYHIHWITKSTTVYMNLVEINLKGDAFVNAPNKIELKYQKQKNSTINTFNTFNYQLQLPSPWGLIDPPKNSFNIKSILKLPFFQIGYFESVDSIPSKEFIGSTISSMFVDVINSFSYIGANKSFPKRNYLWTGSVPGVIEPNGENTIETLIASEKQSGDILKNVAEWLVKLGLADALKLVTTNDRFYEPKIMIENIESALVDVGFGVSQVLPVITMLLTAPEGSIILLEQPELHLHPNAQMLLADLMLYVAEKRNLQLIVESHSEHLLRRLQRRIAEVGQDFANPENIKMYFCEPGNEGSTIKPVEVDEYGQIANWPHNFFGDISGDLEAMTTAALSRRRQELSGD